MTSWFTRIRAKRTLSREIWPIRLPNQGYELNQEEVTSFLMGLAIGRRAVLDYNKLLQTLLEDLPPYKDGKLLGQIIESSEKMMSYQRTRFTYIDDLARRAGFLVFSNWENYEPITN